MGSGKRRWKFSFHRTTTPATLNPEINKPPKEFICSISGFLMADPVIVSSGQTFERNCIQVCKNLGFLPILSDGSRPDFSSVIPNMAIKSTIFNWCDTNKVDRPKPISFEVAEEVVRSLMESQDKKFEEKIEVTEKELLEAVAENLPTLKLTHAVTELNRRATHYYTSSEESVIAAITPTTPLAAFSTRPACYSTCSSSSISSSEIVSDETLNPSLSSSSSSEEEEELLVKLKSNQVFEQEEAVISLRKITRTKEELRVPLCTPRLLSAVRTQMISRYSAIQVNSVAALVNLSLEKVNKVKIVRSGIVPILIDVLKGGFPEAQEHAAGALFSLALDDDNKMAIGVLGALPPLLHMLRSESERARNDSALALYHLSLVHSNRTKLVKLGSIPILLSLVKAGDLASRALLILCNLAACAEGRSVMLDANAVECFVGILRDDKSNSNSTRENCVVALYSLSLGSLRFKGLAKEAGAVEVLMKMAEKGSERAKEKAEKLLLIMKGRNGREGDEEIDWESVLNSGVVSRTGYRLGDSECAKSTGF
ncbi:Ring-type e3 ubiquitin transferase [Thalictrum thalictroides]|uniref:RING-type E3 ubiquitin transferase n=1 Tax=Thalictrum thalictroides TaxID=46969 RepID=A0A7J6XAA1_THATH|nr:Ring-type e3 ubiquitin transferase [Thalictrum thalictroides]